MSAIETAYIDPRPASKIGRLRTALMYLMEEHRSDGALPTSVRFLFYELVARSIIAKSGDRPDKIVSAALTDLRERGLVRWEDIVDETRSVDGFSSSATVAADWLIWLNTARPRPVEKAGFRSTDRKPVTGRRAAPDLSRDYRRAHPRRDQRRSRRFLAYRCRSLPQARR